MASESFPPVPLFAVRGPVGHLRQRHLPGTTLFAVSNMPSPTSYSEMAEI